MPTERPDAIARGNAIDLMSKVQEPRNPFITKPAMIHLISEIPDPAAYGANDLTSLAAINAKSVCEMNQHNIMKRDKTWKLTANITYKK